MLVDDDDNDDEDDARIVRKNKLVIAAEMRMGPVWTLTIPIGICIHI